MNHFELLGLPCRPFLSDEEIGSAYRKLAGDLHPDQAGGDAVAFLELGEAAATLRDPAKRLRELSGGIATNQFPHAAAELFPRVATSLHQADQLMEKYSLASNALSKALLRAPLKSLTRDLAAISASVSTWRESLDQELTRLDAIWPHVESSTLSQHADSYTYAARWEKELRERELALESILG